MCDDMETKTLQDVNTTLQHEVAALKQQLEQTQKLCEQERGLNQVILEAADFLVVMLDIEGRIVRFNRACEQTTGFTAAEVEGQCLWDLLIPPEEREGVKSVFHTLAFDHMPNHYENHWLTKDGHRRLLAWSNTILRNSCGEVTLIIGTARDVTEQRAAEEKLVYNQTLLQGLLEYAPSAIFIKDTEGRVILANKQLEWLLQVEHGQLIGKTANDLVPMELAEQIWATESQTLHTGMPIQIEENVPRGDDVRTLISTKFPIYDLQGKPCAVGGILTDITDRKQAEQQLSIFRSLIENAPDGIALTNPDNTITYANPAFKMMTEYQEDSIKMDINTFYTSKDQQLLQEAKERIQTYGKWQGILTCSPKDGNLFPVHVTSFAVHNDAGKTVANASLLRDRTAQSLQEKAIRDSAERLRTIIEKTPIGICVTNTEQNFEYVNPSYCQIYRYQPEELIGKPFTIVVPEENRQFAIDLHNKFMEGNTEIPSEWQVVAKDGTPLTILANAAAITGEDGQPKKVTFVVDITALKQSEQERQALQEQIIETQQAMIRELSTPLIPLSDSVVLMPLIGTIDTSRAQQVMETLLEGISAHQADIAIMDITGVSVVDTQVANAIIQTAQAVKLLGAQVVLTGIGPTMAQTLVHLGTDLSSIITRGSLQSAIAWALNHHQEQWRQS